MKHDTKLKICTIPGVDILFSETFEAGVAGQPPPGWSGIQVGLSRIVGL
jgi:hypothetical protein